MNAATWKLFDRVANDYDEVVPFFAGFGAAIMAAIDPPTGCRFLDLGAGTGALTAPALDRGCVVTAVDAAPAMCERLAAAYPAAAVQVMDAQNLDFPSGSFDLVAASFVIHVLDDLQFLGWGKGILRDEFGRIEPENLSESANESEADRLQSEECKIVRPIVLA